jgi:23S rRNA pseudouridine1911/1915/1917 synthase
MAQLEGIVGESGAARLDRYVADDMGLLSRSQFKARFVSAMVNGKDAKPSRPLKPGDRFVIHLLDEADRTSASMPEDIALVVLYDDDQVIVVDKAQGMVVHPAHGNWSGTLANALLGRMGTDGAPPRAGIVHRLDKDTSGVIIAAKSAAAQEALAAQFRDRTTIKTYIAITQRRPAEPHGRIDTWLARDPRDRKRFASAPEGTGKRAISEWRVLAEAAGYAVVALRPKTGRTHQLRVHCRDLGCPILGDPIYGRLDRRFPAATLMLHAYELRIRLPGRDEVSIFRAPVPERIVSVAAELGLDPFPNLDF